MDGRGALPERENPGPFACERKARIPRLLQSYARAALIATRVIHAGKLQPRQNWLDERKHSIASRVLAISMCHLKGLVRMTFRTFSSLHSRSGNRKILKLNGLVAREVWGFRQKGAVEGVHLILRSSLRGAETALPQEKTVAPLQRCDQLTGLLRIAFGQVRRNRRQKTKQSAGRGSGHRRSTPLRQG
jgi:hypothetical protein